METTVQVAPKKEKANSRPDAFEQQINTRIKVDEPGELPKVTFNAKEMYEYAYELGKKIPFWKTPQQNPIN